MRALLLCSALLFSPLSFAETSATTDQSLVAEFIRSIEPQLNRDLLSALAIISTQDMISSAAAQAATSASDANSLAQRELTTRASTVFRNYFHSPAFINDVLRPWVEETFTDTELEQLIAFTRTPAGAKFIRSTSRLPMELAFKASQQLQTEIADALFGVKSDEIVRTSRIKRTAAEIRSLASALEAYATDQNRYPAATDVSKLKSFVVPLYIKNMPETDAWGAPLRYVVSADGRHYQIMSGGADGVIERNTAELAAEIRREGPEVMDDETGDIVFQDGTFRVIPRVMAPVITPRVARSTSDRFEAIGGDVQAPQVIRRVEPLYPVEARQARISGTVILETKIDEAGNVSEAKVLRGLSPSIDQAALDSVRQWRFRPATRNGVPVPVVFNLTMNFRLDR